MIHFIIFICVFAIVGAVAIYQLTVILNIKSDDHE